MVIHSHKELTNIAKTILDLKPNIIALEGPLGAGKTTLTKEIAKALDIRENVISPTYVLETEYKIPSSDKLFIHIDCYRMESFDELVRLGIEKRINKNNIVVIEWADKFRSQILVLGSEKKIIWVEIDLGEKEDERRISIPNSMSFQDIPFGVIGNFCFLLSQFVFSNFFYLSF